MASRPSKTPADNVLLQRAAAWQPTHYTLRETKYSPYLPAVQLIVRQHPRVSIVEIVDGFILPQLPPAQRPARKSAGWWRWYHFARRAAVASSSWQGGVAGSRGGSSALTEPAP